MAIAKRESRGQHLLRGRRWPWAAGLALGAVLSGWVALAMLARVTPALFPGQQLPVGAAVPSALDGLPSVPDALKVQSPGAGSVFNRPVVVLVAAVDSRPGGPQDLAAVNTDTIMLARLDPVGKDIRVLSVPRDLLVQVTYEDGSVSEGRVNTSFAIGAGQGGGVDAGMRHLEKDLERDFGVSIDYWVQVDFRGAEQLVDAVGGLDLSIPEALAIDSWWYSDDDEHARTLHFPAGAQHLDGYEAVAFARLRAPDDDLHRIQRQQLVLQAAVARAFSTGLLDDPLSVWDAYGNTVRSDVPRSRMPGYALLVSQTRGRLTTYSLADPVNGAPAVEDRVLPSGAAVLAPVPEQIQFWLSAVFGLEAHGLDRSDGGH